MSICLFNLDRYVNLSYACFSTENVIFSGNFFFVSPKTSRSKAAFLLLVSRIVSNGGINSCPVFYDNVMTVMKKILVARE